MNFVRISLIKLLFILSIFLFPQIILSQNASSKKILNHDDFDNWQKVSNHSVSNNGEWAVFSVNPQEGDGVLTFYNIKSGKKIEIQRGYKPQFTSDSKWGIALIKPFFKDTRQAKIDKLKGFEMPQDSLAIIDLTTGKIRKEGNIIEYSLPKEEGSWVGWLSCDTTFVSKTVLDDSDAGRPLVLQNLKTGNNHRINGVSNFSFSENGENVALKFSKSKKDSLAINGIGVVFLPDTSLRIIDRDKKYYGSPVMSRDGKRIAYTASNDSVETGTRLYQLYSSELRPQLEDPSEIALNLPSKRGRHLNMPHSEDPVQQEALEKEWIERSQQDKTGRLFINQYSEPKFSYNGKRLIIGVAPYVAPDDTTLVEFEKASLDIWRWDAPMIPPKENSKVKKLMAHTYPVVIDLATMKSVLISDKPLEEVEAPDRWDADWALVEDPSENIISSQWDYQYPIDLSVKNVITGEIKNIGFVKEDLYELSPAGKYVMWFSDRQYYCYEIATGKTTLISSDVPYPLWDETEDIPLPEKQPYGTMGWSENDEDILVYDRYDVWSLDPTGKRKPVCLTDGEGRAKSLKFRGYTPEPDFRAFKPGSQILYSVFDYKTKENGLATATFRNVASKPKIEILDGFKFYQVRKAKNKDVYSWIQGNFETSPNVFVSANIEKKEWKRVSDSNPQMKDYRWGTARLVKWNAYDGKPCEGVLYLPEDYNENGSYPMITYFYEELSDLLYHHYDMEPSWSWINFPFYVSRGYAIFVPDVHYTAGVPGESAYNFICSGVEAVCSQYPGIDVKRLGIDGQSWGGYQVSYLVTRTNMFACAGAGAPVANMTSAFGGIRWESGDSRQAQYEMGQSRIGQNLWEAPQLYIANSPVFYADRIQTPLLIMHNDADGAVPWYQGIELFMALRRLGKPVWMLQYNGEAHNIRERRNRKDITIRLQQFFDHYLQGSPMPQWMKNGIPAIRKGQEYGY